MEFSAENKIFSVSEFIALLNIGLRKSEVKIVGEVGQVQFGPTGHVYFILKDENNDTKNRNIDLLEKYFNDIYNLFLRKLSAFAMFESTNNEETIKMQALLQELIKVKNIIINTESYKDQDLL